jgi:hypothetical protein
LSNKAFYALFGVGIVVLLPALFITGYFCDDWVWLWVVAKEGSQAVFNYLLQVSHPGYWVPMALFFKVGGEYAGSVARLSGIICHIINSILLYRILGGSKLTYGISGFAAIIYLLSPFYYLRGTMSHNIYDIFMLCALLSIYLMIAEKKYSVFAALPFLIMSLSHEALLAMEPLRILYVYGQDNNLKNTVKRCLPFWITIIIFIIIRFTLLKPYGLYEGYNEIHISLKAFLDNLIAHFLYYPDALGFSLVSATKMLPGSEDIMVFVNEIARRLTMLRMYPSIGYLFLALLSTIFIYKSIGKVQGRIAFKFPGVTTSRVFIAIVLIVLGAVPFAAAGRIPYLHDINSRFAYVSIPGISILMASFIGAIRYPKLRMFILGCMVIIFGLTSLQVSKWYIYDSLMQRDLNIQMAQMIPSGNENLPMFYLSYYPHSNSILALYRNLRSYEMNIPINMKRNEKEPHIFLYNDAWPRESKNFYCTISNYDRYPCPAETAKLDYKLLPEYSSVEKVPYWLLIKSVFASNENMLRMGNLTNPDGWLERHRRRVEKTAS